MGRNRNVIGSVDLSHAAELTSARHRGWPALPTHSHVGRSVRVLRTENGFRLATGGSQVCCEGRIKNASDN